VGEFTADEKLKAIEREIGLRRRVYPRLIGRGMSTAEAEREIAIMLEIANDYRKATQPTLL
jgi:hypothetical protein